MKKRLKQMMTIITNFLILSLLFITGCGRCGSVSCNTPSPPGPMGSVGIQGQVGAGCTIVSIPANVNAPNGGATIQCGNSQSLILNGTNGTVITAIQFCPGSTIYPSTFPEIGFCINNNIYAVYSANGGFLTEVVPGNYSSDGINASCSFTVNPNCQITY